jgi:hypothetical protein
VLPLGTHLDLKRRSRALLLATVAAATLGALAVIVTAPTTTRRQAANPRHRSAPDLNERARWSAPGTLAACSQDADPRVVFPQETPFRRTGRGAVVFAGDRACKPGSGAALAAISAADMPAAPRHPHAASGGPIGIAGLAEAAATTQGQIVVIGAASLHASGLGAELSEGPAEGPFAPAQPLGGAGAPLGLATAYLGDVAIASVDRGRDAGVQLRMQRHFASGFAAPIALGGAGAGQRALAVALDYRTDALAVWWQDGWLYARERHANGPLGPLQRFAKAGPGVRLGALISDDGRAIVAWVDPRGGSAGVYLDISQPRMQLGAGHLVERLRWHGGAFPTAASVRLVRLSTESVLMAWTGTQAGRFVVRAAGIDLEGLRTISIVSRPAEDALLEDLVAGPRGDAVAVWSSPRSGRRGRGGPPAAIMAARGVPSSRGVPRFGAPEHIAASTHHGRVAVAIDPASDTAVASWRERGGAIRFSVRRAISVVRHGIPAACRRSQWCAMGFRQHAGPISVARDGIPAMHRAIGARAREGVAARAAASS